MPLISWSAVPRGLLRARGACTALRAPVLRAREVTVNDPNPYAPPSAAADAGAGTGNDARPNDVWREGTLLVVPRSGARLPDRCVCCNAPALGYSVRQTARSHSVWLMALVSQSVTLEVGLCPRHRARRTFGHVLLIAGLLSPLLVAVGVEWWLGMPLFAGGIVGGLQLLRVVRGGRMDERYARVKVGVPFLLSIPSRLPGRPPR